MKLQLPTKFSKNKILAIGLLVVAVVGYYIFRSSQPPEEALTSVTSGAPATIGQEIIIELNRLKALRNIKDDIFKDPKFTSLQDFTQTVVPQSVGRSNPFSPVGSN